MGNMYIRASRREVSAIWTAWPIVLNKRMLFAVGFDFEIWALGLVPFELYSFRFC